MGRADVGAGHRPRAGKQETAARFRTRFTVPVSGWGREDGRLTAVPAGRDL